MAHLCVHEHNRVLYIFNRTYLHLRRWKKVGKHFTKHISVIAGVFVKRVFVYTVSNNINSNSTSLLSFTEQRLNNFLLVLINRMINSKIIIHWDDDEHVDVFLPKKKIKLKTTLSHEMRSLNINTMAIRFCMRHKASK